MSYEIRVAKQAESYLRRLDGRTQDRVLARLNQIAVDPYGPHTKPLTNAADSRAARVGVYRLIFSVDDIEYTVNVTAIGPRGDVYRQL